MNIIIAFNERRKRRKVFSDFPIITCIDDIEHTKLYPEEGHMFLLVSEKKIYVKANNKLFEMKESGDLV